MQTINIVVKKNEEKIFPFVWVNGNDSEVSVVAHLVGDGASLRIIGIFLGTGSRSIVFNTHVVHEGKNTKSITTIRGVFKEHAAFTNDGLVRINRGAKGADGYFASKILLFDDAKGRSVPSLEIDENELKAGHASTVGRPDENQMFYLRSRGLLEKEAEELIVTGFFEPVIKLFPASEQSRIKRRLNEEL